MTGYQQSLHIASHGFCLVALQAEVKDLLEELLHEAESLRDNSGSAAPSERAGVTARALGLSHMSSATQASPARPRIRAPAVGTVHFVNKSHPLTRCMLEPSMHIWGTQGLCT